MTHLDQAEALSNARNGASMTNYPAIFAGFQAMGIPASEIKPRENVFTFHAWRALGRSVKRGEHGVKVVTWIPVTDRDTGEVTGKRPKTAVVFHETQTVELGADPKAGGYDHVQNTRAEYVRDPGEDAADRWCESHS